MRLDQDRTSQVRSNQGLGRVQYRVRSGSGTVSGQVWVGYGMGSGEVRPGEVRTISQCI